MTEPTVPTVADTFAPAMDALLGSPPPVRFEFWDGSGIGLFVVQQIVDHDLGGSISVTSTAADGTTFKVVLQKPIAKDAPTGAKPQIS